MNKTRLALNTALTTALLATSLFSSIGHAAPGDGMPASVGSTHFDLSRDPDLAQFSKAVRARIITLAADPDSADLLAGFQAIDQNLKDLEAGQMDRAVALQSIAKISEAILNHDQVPTITFSELNLSSSIFKIRKLMVHPSGRGDRRFPSTNLGATSSTDSDLSRLDPMRSTFWKKTDIKNLDLSVGFGREQIAAVASPDTICKYKGPKNSYGGHPGFDLTCDGQKFKIKFGEINTEAFGSRITWALGFNTEPSDFASAVKIEYDRKIFTEYNSRLDSYVDIVSNIVPNLPSGPHEPFARQGFPLALVWPAKRLAHINNQIEANPFLAIASAKLKDGTEIIGSDAVRTFLLRDEPLLGQLPPSGPWSHFWNYIESNEQKIEYLVLNPANFRTKKSADDKSTNIGYFNWNGSDRLNQREFRGFGMVAAWLNSWDTRPGNTKFNLIQKDGRSEIQEVVSDMGTVLGTVYPMQLNRPSLPWLFTRPLQEGSTSVPIADFNIIQDIAPFRQMNIDDARWGARLIASLSEEQILSALISSGFEAAQAKLLLEKLVNRRDKMVEHLGLLSEFALLRPAHPDREIPNVSYDPRKDGPLTAKSPSGVVLTAREGDFILVKGNFKKR